MTTTLLILAFLALLAGVLLYNDLVRNRNLVSEA